MDGESVSGHGTSASLDGAREEFLTLLLGRFEKGELEAYEYTRRVRALELAGSVDLMADIATSATTQDPAYDAVDMIMMARKSSALTPKRSSVRFLWPAILGFFLVVLLIVGLWLAGHAHALHTGPSGLGGVRSFVGAIFS